MNGWMLAAILAATPCEPMEVSISSGLDWSSGDYGLDTETSALLAPISIDLDLGDLTLSAGGAYAVIEGPAGITAPDGEVFAPRASDDARRDGFTDLSLGGSWSRTAPTWPGWIALSGGATLPTADPDEGLGAGSSDLFAGLELGYDADPFLLAVNLNYRATDVAGLRDPVGAGVSILRLVGADGVLGASLDARQSTIPGLAPQAEISVFAGGSISPSVRLDAYLVTGLTGASSDLGFGLSLRRSLGVTDRAPSVRN
ncbi:hypothetical protein [Phenylobacterium sp.]|uniref:hypothetical protein n=1 Tax=Phenylobacterium sp. TaxID=1871053 RepID=UPI002732B622|nr:hypothetical protein [Phenylobacterium sp.]MDP3852617.1 hypothetical protein [Phenylobacterium sp.]